MYNPNNPSNWSWSKAFDEMEKTINISELTQQVINHLGGYTGETKYAVSYTHLTLPTIYSV